MDRFIRRKNVEHYLLLGSSRQAESHGCSSSAQERDPVLRRHRHALLDAAGGMMVDVQKLAGARGDALAA
jgi:hypothetical protein